VTPYAELTFFALLLYPVLATLALGLFEWAGRWWTLSFTALAVALLYYGRSSSGISEIWILVGFAAWQLGIVWIFKVLRTRPGWSFYAAIGASLLPLAAAKSWPFLFHGREFGFLGISYVTFRALDLLFCLRDKSRLSFRTADFLGYLFFFPTISSGPIDRYRRFTADLTKRRSRSEFLRDIDAAVHRLFRGFLYKFIFAALINHYWLERTSRGGNFITVASYMYAYSLYLFFDFAGYSAFAIALSYILGIHTPENFNRPFLARNIRDFWNRWHITLSFWFRDHVYMRFLLTARRRDWFRSKQTAGIFAYFVSFGLMGLWHGPQLQYILYGFYQATLLSGFDIYSNWSTRRGAKAGGMGGHILSVIVTFHAVCFGFLIFSGRLTTVRIQPVDGAFENADCEQILGWVWDRGNPDAAVSVDFFDQDELIATVAASQLRADLAQGGYGNGRHGFVLATPARLMDGQTHLVYARVRGSAQNLRESPKPIICPGPP
jgi:membrane protein involved in D-alanine export